MVLTLYIDYLSQPSRAVLAFCLFTKIDFEIKEISVMKGEHLKPEYKKINPFSLVPTINDDGFIVQESGAILKYLCRTRKVADHWYPNDPKKASIIDAYLDWHHTNTRRAAFFFRAMSEKLFGGLVLKTSAEAEKKIMMKALEMLENVWLKERKFIADDNELSIADLVACSELMHLILLDFDFSPFPKVNEWMQRVMFHEAMEKVHDKLKAFKKDYVSIMTNSKL